MKTRTDKREAHTRGASSGVFVPGMAWVLFVDSAVAFYRCAVSFGGCRSFRDSDMEATLTQESPASRIFFTSIINLVRLSRLLAITEQARKSGETLAILAMDCHVTLCHS